MGNFLGNTKLGAGVKMAFYRDRYYGGNSYFHYKTNVNMNNIMVMIEAIGYAYGAGAAIRSAVCFYAYAGSGSVISIGTSNVYGGMSMQGAYTSSDGYACFYLYCPSYYSGWVFNSYTLNPTGYDYDVAISSVTQTSSTSNQY
jgi:hypothetical protein